MEPLSQNLTCAPPQTNYLQPVGLLKFLLWLLQLLHSLAYKTDLILRLWDPWNSSYNSYNSSMLQLQTAPPPKPNYVQALYEACGTHEIPIITLTIGS